jgi:hypothetical protein
MKPQTLYRGGDNKKEKPTKVDKVWNVAQKEKRRAEARKKEKAA